MDDVYEDTKTFVRLRALRAQYQGQMNSHDLAIVMIKAIILEG